ncbi:hypothetical protein NE237_010740 [Protea cynaroides]|uniref:Uncharacterized protein n=1 Tax=Protea cynaroides TaxID=273540 RepID=A0A9Q0R1I1_9MAGN|nr:hypothetical protein NE237_010740 [Protea cynaroides]
MIESSKVCSAKSKRLCSACLNDMNTECLSASRRYSDQSEIRLGACHPTNHAIVKANYRELRSWILSAFLHISRGQSKGENEKYRKWMMPLYKNQGLISRSIEHSNGSVLICGIYGRRLKTNIVQQKELADITTVVALKEIQFARFVHGGHVICGLFDVGVHVNYEIIYLLDSLHAIMTALPRVFRCPKISPLGLVGCQRCSCLSLCVVFERDAFLRRYINHHIFVIFNQGCFYKLYAFYCSNIVWNTKYRKWMMPLYKNQSLISQSIEHSNCCVLICGIYGRRLKVKCNLEYRRLYSRMIFPYQVG